jgi:hypothetical protein
LICTQIALDFQSWRKERSYTNPGTIPFFCLALKNWATVKNYQENSTPRILPGSSGHIPENILQLISFSHGSYIAKANKTLHILEKVGAYWFWIVLQEYLKKFLFSHTSLKQSACD